MGFEVFENPDCRARVAAVRDGCKYRLVTVSSVDQVALKPLHDVLYDHLSGQRWLLRGDAVASSFSGFTSRKGEVFVSGDYESATDNISSDVVRAVLVALRGTSGLPGSVWDLALTRSQSFLEGPGCCGVQSRGQLMGTFLSFPLLCLVNYLTFRWLVPRPGVPVRVNGDDIVFRASPSEAERWLGGVGGAGLVLSRGKTLVHESCFTLNSALFRGGRFKAHALPFVRSRALFDKPSSPSAWAGQYASLCPGFSGPSARVWKLYFLREHQTQLWLSQRSATRGLGARVGESLLRQAGLLRRERFYLGFESEEPLPSVVEPGLPTTAFPRGFASYTRSSSGLSVAAWRRARALEGSFHLALRLHAQSPPSVHTEVEWRARVQRGTAPFWEPRPCVRRFFNRRWRLLAAPYSKVVGPPRRCERLLLPALDGRGEREGLGAVGVRLRSQLDGL